MKINIKPLERLHEAYLNGAGIPQEVLLLVARYNTLKRDKADGKFSEEESIEVLDGIVHSLFLLIGVDVSERQPGPVIATGSIAAGTELLSEEEGLKELLDRVLTRVFNRDAILLKNRFDRLILFRINKILSESLYQRELQRIHYTARTMNQDFPEGEVVEKENPASSEKARLCIGDIQERIGLMHAIFDSRGAGEQIKLFGDQYDKIQRDLNLGLLSAEEYLMQLNRMDFGLLTLAENLLR